MTLADRFDLSDAREAAVLRALQVVLLGLTVLGAVVGRIDIAVNAAGSLAVTFLPALLRRETGVRMDVGLVLWLAAAATLHAVGILGPYKNVWWWDYVTHALSASIIAGVAYAAVTAYEREREDLFLPEPYRSGFLFMAVMAVGVAWEAAEFTVTQLSMALGASSSVLVVFGPVDILTDLLFTFLGGVAVVLWGRGYFRTFSRKLTGMVSSGTSN